MKPTEEFTQLRFHFTDPIQPDYEVIRPIVLFAQPVAARSEETDIKRTTVGEKARRFVTGGMLGLVDRRALHYSSIDAVRENLLRKQVVRIL